MITIHSQYSTQKEHLNTANTCYAAIKQIQHLLCCILFIPFSLAICSIIYYCFILVFQLWNLNQISGLQQYQCDIFCHHFYDFLCCVL